MKVTVKHEKDSYEIVDLTDDTTLFELRRKIHVLTGVVPSMQKLAGIRIPKDSDESILTLKECHVKDKAKIMMIGSRLEQFITSNVVYGGGGGGSMGAPARSTSDEGDTFSTAAKGITTSTIAGATVRSFAGTFAAGKALAVPRSPVIDILPNGAWWSLPFFSSMLTDAFIDGKHIIPRGIDANVPISSDSTSCALALCCFDMVLQRFNRTNFNLKGVRIAEEALVESGLLEGSVGGTLSMIAEGLPSSITGVTGGEGGNGISFVRKKIRYGTLSMLTLKSKRCILRLQKIISSGFDIAKDAETVARYNNMDGVVEVVTGIIQKIENLRPCASTRDVLEINNLVNMMKAHIAATPSLSCAYISHDNNNNSVNHFTPTTFDHIDLNFDDLYKQYSSFINSRLLAGEEGFSPYTSHPSFSSTLSSSTFPSEAMGSWLIIPAGFINKIQDNRMYILIKKNFALPNNSEIVFDIAPQKIKVQRGNLRGQRCKAKVRYTTLDESKQQQNQYNINIINNNNNAIENDNDNECAGGNENVSFSSKGALGVSKNESYTVVLVNTSPFPGCGLSDYHMQSYQSTVAEVLGCEKEFAITLLDTVTPSTNNDCNISDLKQQHGNEDVVRKAEARRVYDKIKAQTCVTFTPVSKERLTDVSFWLLLYSMWAKGIDPHTINNIEYCRAEVLYDVLFPWLVEYDPSCFQLWIPKLLRNDGTIENGAPETQMGEKDINFGNNALFDVIEGRCNIKERPRMLGNVMSPHYQGCYGNIVNIADVIPENAWNNKTKSLTAKSNTTSSQVDDNDANFININNNTKMIDAIKDKEIVVPLSIIAVFNVNSTLGLYHSDFNTPERSNTTSATKALMQCVYYLLTSMGLTHTAVKRFKFIMKYETYRRAADELYITATKFQAQNKKRIEMLSDTPEKANEVINMIRNNKTEELLHGQCSNGGSVVVVAENQHRNQNGGDALIKIVPSSSPSDFLSVPLSVELKGAIQDYAYLREAMQGMRDVGIDVSVSQVHISKFFAALYGVTDPGPGKATAVAFAPISAVAGSNAERGLVKNKENIVISPEEYLNRDKVIVIYYGGSWCNSCKKVSPFVIELYEHLQDRFGGPKNASMYFEFILVPIEKGQDDYDHYVELFPFHRVAFNPVVIQRLTASYEVNSLPQMLVFGGDGTMLTSAGVQALLEDCEGTHFPYSPWNGAFPLGHSNQKLFEFAAHNLCHQTIKKYDPGYYVRLADGDGNEESTPKNNYNNNSNNTSSQNEDNGKDDKKQSEISDEPSEETVMITKTVMNMDANNNVNNASTSSSSAVVGLCCDDSHSCFLQLTDEQAQEIYSLTEAVETLRSALPTRTDNGILMTPCSFSSLGVNSRFTDENDTSFFSYQTGESSTSGYGSAIVPTAGSVGKECIDIAEEAQLFKNIELLSDTTSREEYVGKKYNGTIRSLSVIGDLQPPMNLVGLTICLYRALEHVKKLWVRARDNTSSRVAAQMQIIEFISWLFSRIIPLPRPEALPLQVIQGAVTSAEKCKLHPFLYLAERESMTALSQSRHGRNAKHSALNGTNENTEEIKDEDTADINYKIYVSTTSSLYSGALPDFTEVKAFAHRSGIELSYISTSQVFLDLDVIAGRGRDGGPAGSENVLPTFSNAGIFSQTTSGGAGVFSSFSGRGGVTTGLTDDNQQDTQIFICTSIYYLMLSYITGWQAIETPTRAFDAERAIISMAMLTVYDAVARNTNNAVKGLYMASLLSYGDNKAVTDTVNSLLCQQDTAFSRNQWGSEGVTSGPGTGTISRLNNFCAGNVTADNDNNDGRSFLFSQQTRGFCLSTTIGKYSRSFADASFHFELNQPYLHAIRNAIITYISYNELKTNKRCIFDFSCIDGLEVRKYSETLIFLRKFLELCGYKLGGEDPSSGNMPPEGDFAMNNGNDDETFSEGGIGGPNLGGDWVGEGTSTSANNIRVVIGNAFGRARQQASHLRGNEMEKLLYWFCDESSPMANEHPEFWMLRDMVVLTKFMSTMEMRDVQLLRKRKELDQLASWRLSLEEDLPGRQMGSSWRTRLSPPTWEVALIRGRDKDIADLKVKGFGDREIVYGEGLVLQSPIDVGAKLNIEDPTEEDILHAPTLPTFFGVLSQEESESLWFILTVPYLRIPLILDYFSTHERYTYLISPPIQAVLRSALFECGGHLMLFSRDEYSEQFKVPLRLNQSQKQAARLAEMMSATADVDTTFLLGCPNGLLLNELLQNPQSILSLWLRILLTIKELGLSSVYSTNATYVLFLVEVTCGLLGFVKYAVDTLTDKLKKESRKMGISVGENTDDGDVDEFEEDEEVMEFQGKNGIKKITGLMGDENSGYSDDDTVFSEDTIQSLRKKHRSRCIKVLQQGRRALREALVTFVFPLFDQWLVEAEENNDMSSLCVVHSYNAMMFNVLPDYLNSVDDVKQQQQQYNNNNSSKQIEQTSSSLQYSNKEPQAVKVKKSKKRAEHLKHLLSSCAFVRAWQGFGMGGQRSQLTSQGDNDILSPEHKLIRFLQAQGLKTSHITHEMLSECRRLMMSTSEGKRRAVFVQIRGRNYSDTVRVPCLFRSDPTSTSECKALKLPPVDVPENELFRILQQNYTKVNKLLTAASTSHNDAMASKDLDMICTSITRIVFRDKLTRLHKAPSATIKSGDNGNNSRKTIASLASATTELRQPSNLRWVVTAAGLVVAPAENLTLRMFTCELFWKDEELKPVPDTMTRFIDYEIILGRASQLVSRSISVISSSDNSKKNNNDDINNEHDTLNSTESDAEKLSCAASNNQCVLIQRTEHRHWVHIIGTCYDVIHWDEHDSDNQGVRCPVAVKVTPKGDRNNINNQGEGRIDGVDEDTLDDQSMLNARSEGGLPGLSGRGMGLGMMMRLSLRDGGREGGRRGRSSSVGRGQSAGEIGYSAWSGGFSSGSSRPGNIHFLSDGADNFENDAEMIESIKFEGVLYGRPVDPFEGTPWEVRSERWAVNIVRRVFAAAYRNRMELKFSPLLPEGEYKLKQPDPNWSAGEDKQVIVDEIRLMVDDEKQYPKEQNRKTFKEVVVSRETVIRLRASASMSSKNSSNKNTINVVARLELGSAPYGEEFVVENQTTRLDIFTLTPHARKMYRVLDYSTNQRLSMSSLAIVTKPRLMDEQFSTFKYEAGDIKRRIRNDGSLEIHRYNKLIRGDESYMPSHLLQSIVPSCLLENFLFWMGEDMVIRGYPSFMSDAEQLGDLPIDSKTGEPQGLSEGVGEWFHYLIDIELDVLRIGEKQRKEKRNLLAKTGMERGSMDISTFATTANHQGVFRKDYFGSQCRIIRKGVRQFRPIKVSPSSAPSAFDDSHLSLLERSSLSTLKQVIDVDAILFETSSSASSSSLSTRKVPIRLPDVIAQRLLLYALGMCKNVVCNASDWLKDPINEPVLRTLYESELQLQKGQQLQTARDENYNNSNIKIEENTMEVTNSSHSSSGVSVPGIRSSSRETNTEGFSQRDEREQTTESTLYLLRLQDCPHLGAIARLFSKVEDASHILVWGKYQDDKDGQYDGARIGRGMTNSVMTFDSCGDSLQSKRVPLMKIHVIELPRLKAKFQPRSELETFISGEGSSSSFTLPLLSSLTRKKPVVHLWLVDYPGWRIATLSEMRKEWNRLSKLLEPFEQALTMYNVNSGEFALFLPSHDFARLDVLRDPFSRCLMYDHGSLQWKEAVPSPFYLIPVHISYEFLVPPSLSASLYLVDLLAARQEYARAMRFIEACYTDIPFTTEEHFMFSLMMRTLTSLNGGSGDHHPDAHAVRLKLAHSVLYSTNKVSYDVAAELTLYLMKLRHVSANCVLSREDLTDLLKHCERSNTVIRTQLEYWAALTGALEGKRKNHAILHLPTPIRGGEPWERLLTLPHAMLFQAQEVTRLTYKGLSSPLTDSKLVEFLWSDSLIDDEISGANNDLGFFFLYTLFQRRSRTHMEVMKKDVVPTMAVLLSRYFHLRHSRWGRQIAGASEDEQRPSMALITLAMREQFPQEVWPELTDGPTLSAMGRGLNTGEHHSRILGVGGMGFGDSSEFEGRPENTKTPMQIWLSAINSLIRNLKKYPIGNRSRAVYQKHPPDVVPCFDHLIKRIEPSNTSVSSVLFAPEKYKIENMIQKKHWPIMTSESVKSMASFLFNDIGLMQRFLVKDGENVGKDQNNDDINNSDDLMPFNLKPHPQAQSLVAHDMLIRLENDVRTFRHQQLKTVKYVFALLKEGSAVSKAFEMFFNINNNDDIVNGGISLESAATQLILELSALICLLQQLQHSDQNAVRILAEEVSQLANEIHMKNKTVNNNNNNNNEEHFSESSLSFHNGPNNNNNKMVTKELFLFKMSRRCRKHNPVTVEWLLGLLLSTTMHNDMQKVNPYHGGMRVMQQSLIALMMYSNRAYFARQVASSAQLFCRFLKYMVEVETLRLAIVKGGENSDGDVAWLAQNVVDNASVLGIDYDVQSLALLMSGSTSDKILFLANLRVTMRSKFQQLNGALVDQLAVERHYVIRGDNNNNNNFINDDSYGDDALILDPRFLLFEFVFSIVLRKRQVEMINWFYDNVKNQNRSRVQQMIMGQGKTTVVGPLLALMLSDGDTLVTQVMPTALLEQTRSILRKCFTVIVPKRIFTLQFDRNVEDSESVIHILRQKLQSAITRRSLVVSAPECIKALFLKFIELLHSIDVMAQDGSFLSALGGGSGEGKYTRRAQEATLLRRKAMARSKMADAISPILQMCCEGVLIMDEVDVLLHPLKSELNFPVGLKYPIELSGDRWKLPMHILGGVLTFASRYQGETRHKRNSVMNDNNYSNNTQCQQGISISEKDLISQQINDNSGNSFMGKQLSLLQNISPHFSTGYFFSSSPQNFKGEEPSDYSRTIVLNELYEVIKEGVDLCKLQREPHLTLLDTDYYHYKIRPVVAKWAVFWLWDTIHEAEAKQRKRLAAEARRVGARYGSKWEGNTRVKKFINCGECDNINNNINYKNVNVSHDSYNQDNKNHTYNNNNIIINNGDVHQQQLLELNYANFYHLAMVFLLKSRDLASLCLANQSSYHDYNNHKDRQHLPSFSSFSATDAAECFIALFELNTRLQKSLLPYSVQLLFLARDWIDTLLPHTLSKIDRVGYGILQANDYAAVLQELILTTGGGGDGGLDAAISGSGIPLSRRLMAVPFVAKDVPSRSSEFAHPDVVIGLTILAYNYEGMRKSDIKALMKQLKQDYSRQAGPRELRPASVLYHSWMLKATEKMLREGKPIEGVTVVPLSQLQLQDQATLTNVWTMIRAFPDTIHYYLNQHVFPRTMAFQRMKISACGHELGSNILFGKRIGFSGTPSNLLPLDLGECFYEPGSDGKILNVLTDPKVTSCELLDDGWTPIKVLYQIATASPPYHALIDAGALITNFDNQQVARILLQVLPRSFEGIVFLDSRDRKMVLERSKMQVVPLGQCGIAPGRRFTFFDQVHTTGMDIQQSATATAVVTIGKDMVFRDYAQGSFRMRGIGKGQKIKLFLIPEVTARIKETLGKVPQIMKSSNAGYEVTVPAWLLLNAMNVEELQFIKLSLQELDNVWRKAALGCLLKNSLDANDHPSRTDDDKRMKRFLLPPPHSSGGLSVKSLEATLPITTMATLDKELYKKHMLRLSIEHFRELIGYPIPSALEIPVPYAEKVRKMIENKPKELLSYDCINSPDINGHQNFTDPFADFSFSPSSPFKSDDKLSLNASQDTGYARVRAVYARIVSSSSATAKRHGVAAGTVGCGRGNDNGGKTRPVFVDDGQQLKELGLNTEVVHEQEAEEEQQQEEEQKEQRINAYSRDNEESIPWDVRELTVKKINRRERWKSNVNVGYEKYVMNLEDDEKNTEENSDDTADEESNKKSMFAIWDNPFYPVSYFQVRVEQPRIRVSSYLMLSDNFFRKRWAGLGERRLRNCVVFLQWIDTSNNTAHYNGGHSDSSSSTEGNILCAAVTLAEAETLRWIIHHNEKIALRLPMSLRIVGSGAYLDVSFSFLKAMRLKKKKISKSGADDSLRHHYTMASFMRSEASVFNGLTIDDVSSEFMHDISFIYQKENDNNNNKLQQQEMRIITKDPHVSPPSTAANEPGGNISSSLLTSPINDTNKDDFSLSSGFISDIPALWYRFFNNDMFYSKKELFLLESRVLQRVPVEHRLAFFLECQRLRRRARNQWEDAPVANLLAREEDMERVRNAGELRRLNTALERLAQNEEVELKRKRRARMTSDKKAGHAGGLGYVVGSGCGEEGGRGMINNNNLTEHEWMGQQIAAIQEKRKAEEGQRQNAHEGEVTFMGALRGLFKEKVLNQTVELLNSGEGEEYESGKTMGINKIKNGGSLYISPQLAAEALQQSIVHAIAEVQNQNLESPDADDYGIIADSVTPNINRNKNNSKEDSSSLSNAMSEGGRFLKKNAIIPRPLAAVDFTRAMEGVEMLAVEAANAGAFVSSPSLMSPVVDAVEEDAMPVAQDRSNSHRKGDPRQGELLSYGRIIAAIPLLSLHYEPMQKNEKSKKRNREDMGGKALKEEAAAAIPDFWDCSVCTLINPRSSQHCGACTAGRPKGFETPVSSEDGEAEDDFHVTSGVEAPWNCPACTFFNEQENTHCTICNTGNPIAAKAAMGKNGGKGVGGGVLGFRIEVPEGKWMCSPEHGGCTQFNDNDAFYCASCDRARPDLASLRF